MSTTDELESLIERLKAGDEAARSSLIERSQQRFELLARKMLRDFERLRLRADTNDILQRTMLRLWQALEKVELNDAQHFLRLGALNMRRELLDLVREVNRDPAAPIQPDEGDSENPHGTPKCDTHDPRQLERWTEFHQQIENLPAAERDVFDLMYYQGLTQKDTAAQLKISAKTTKVRWDSSRVRISKAVDEFVAVRLTKNEWLTHGQR